MKKRTITEKNFAGLNYVTIVNIPIKETKHGIAWDVDYSSLERQVAIILIKDRVPIRGIELKLIQSAIRLKNNELAERIGVHFNTINNWRKREKSLEHLAQPYEISIRLLAAEILGVELEPTLDSLKSSDKAKKIKLEAA